MYKHFTNASCAGRSGLVVYGQAIVAHLTTRCWLPGGDNQVPGFQEATFTGRWRQSAISKSRVAIVLDGIDCCDKSVLGQIIGALSDRRKAYEALVLVVLVCPSMGFPTNLPARAAGLLHIQVLSCKSIAWCLNQLVEQLFLRRQLPIMIDGNFLEYLVGFSVTAQGGIQGFLQHLKYLLHNFFWEEQMSFLCMAMLDDRTWKHTISELDPVVLLQNITPANARDLADPSASTGNNQRLDDSEKAQLAAQRYLHPYLHERWCIEALGLVLSMMTPKLPLHQYTAFDLTISGILVDILQAAAGLELRVEAACKELHQLPPGPLCSTIVNLRHALVDTRSVDTFLGAKINELGILAETLTKATEDRECADGLCYETTMWLQMLLDGMRHIRSLDSNAWYMFPRTESRRGDLVPAPLHTAISCALRSPDHYLRCDRCQGRRLPESMVDHCIAFRAMDEGTGILDGNAWHDAFTQVVSRTSDIASDVSHRMSSPFEVAIQDLAYVGFVEERRPEPKFPSSAIYIRLVY